MSAGFLKFEIEVIQFLVGYSDKLCDMFNLFGYLFIVLFKKLIQFGTAFARFDDIFLMLKLQLHYLAFYLFSFSSDISNIFFVFSVRHSGNFSPAMWASQRCYSGIIRVI